MRVRCLIVMSASFHCVNAVQEWGLRLLTSVHYCYSHGIDSLAPPLNYESPDAVLVTENEIYTTFICRVNITCLYRMRGSSPVRRLQIMLAACWPTAGCHI